MDDTKKQTTADKAVEKIIESDKGNKKDALLTLIPEGQSPKLYIDLVKSTVLGTTKDGQSRPSEDLMLFLYTANRTGLDPLAKQIYAVYRWDNREGREKMTIQTGIDGLRLVAQRSGMYAGQDEITYEPKEESTKYPIKASVVIYKIINGARVAFQASARWSEYVQIGKTGEIMGLWAKMPYLMLGKCAEGLALRKAFPNELSGIYSDIEMQQSSNILADLPKPDKIATGGLDIQVMHGAPVDTKPGIGSDEPKKITEKNKKNVEEGDILKIREKIETMKERVKNE